MVGSPHLEVVVGWLHEAKRTFAQGNATAAAMVPPALAYASAPSLPVSEKRFLEAAGIRWVSWWRRTCSPTGRGRSAAQVPAAPLALSTGF